MCPESISAEVTITGGEALARMLQAHGVGPMFGMGGFQLLPYYDAVRRLGLKHHLINDERCGVFAADAYARVTNRPGVCDATLGPGTTNLVTGLVESLNAGIPQIVICGDSNRDYSWRNMTQEARQTEILRPAVKDLIRVEHTKRIPELVRRAFAIATSGRPGPVVLDIPEDVCHGTSAFSADDLWHDVSTESIPSRPMRPSAEAIERSADAIVAAERPILLVGGGVHISGAYAELLALAETQVIPVCHTMSGKGAIPCTHPYSAGLFGRYSRIANEMITEADLVIVVGCKLGEIATKRFQLLNPQIPLVHIDILPEEIGRTSRYTHALVGDARLTLQDLNDALRGKKPSCARQSFGKSTKVRMMKWRAAAAERLDTNEEPIGVGRLINELNKAMPSDAILVADGGFAAHWGGLVFDTKVAGRHFVANRGFASIGYGLPGGLGTQLAAGDRRVVALTGDGGLNMTIGELETAKRVGAPLVLCVINNAASGYVKALQHAMYGRASYQSSDLIEQNYAAIANEFGCLGLRVERPDQLSSAIRNGLENASTPTIIDIVATRDASRMLPGVDNRMLTVEKGDRPV